MTAKDGWRAAVRGALLENLGLKLISLMFALGVYAFIHGAENFHRTIAVSVVSVMPPESANRQLMTQLPTEITVTVRGSRTQLDDLRADDLGTLQLDLRSARETRIDIDPSMFHVPVGLTVEQIYPSAIEVRWDDVNSRQIAVQIARTGELAAGLIVKGSIAVEPPVINARGPRSVVDVLQFARAAPFDVTGLGEGVHRRTLALDRPPNLVTYDADSVVATVEVTRELARLPLPNLKVEVVGVARATTKPPTVNVVITGPAEDVNAIEAEAIVPRVEPKAGGADTSKPGSAYLDVLVDAPPRVKVEVQPVRVFAKW
jgi:YbbR domain-containing protein